MTPFATVLIDFWGLAKQGFGGSVASGFHWRHRWSAAPPTLVVTLFALIASGCSNSPPVRHYLLEASFDSVSVSQGVSIGLHPVSVPEYLQRGRVLVNVDNGALVYSRLGRWSEPLPDAIQRVSRLQLAQQLGTGDFRSWPWSAGVRPDWEVRINVLALERRGETSHLTAEVALRDNRIADAAWQRVIRSWQDTAAGDTDTAIVASYSDLVSAMNDDIAARLRSAP